MAKPAGTSQVKAVFFIFLLFSAHAYRLDVNQQVARAQSKLVSEVVSFSNVNASRVQQAALTNSYSYSQSFTRTTSVIQTSSGYASRTSIASTAQHCIPEMYTGQTLKPIRPPANPGVSAMWPLLLATAVVLMGGLYLYHRHRLNSPPEAQFCPVSSWEADPVRLLVPPTAFDAFTEISTFLGESAANSRGMPKCSGLRRHRLRTDCDGDVDCKRQACRRMCCDRRDCTFFQFNNIDSTDYCWLGSRSRLSRNTCEQPWFGETCTSCRARRVELWPQIHSDNSKCQSSLFGSTGFHVDNQYECQSHAEEVGHEYYQYDESRRRCETSELCDDPSTNTVHNWKIFSKHDVDVPEPAHAQVPQDQETWQFEPFLFHEHTGLTTVPVTSAQQCTAGDVPCMREVCRSKCLEQTGCIHYQFKNSGSECRLGVTHVIDEDHVGMWFGGVLTQDRSCSAEEFKCPSSEECVDQCGDCAGFGREGPDNYCVRSAIQNMVDASMWVNNYNTAPIDAWCRGFQRTPVTMSAAMANGQSGADVCRAACASDPTCAVWQMYTQDSERTDYSEGSHVRCWLGMEDKMGRPLFSCTGRSPKRWRLLSAPRSEAMEQRGCQDGRVACVLTNSCVDLCQDECPGFTITDAEAGLCQPPANPVMREDGVPMKVAVAGNLPSTNTNPDNSMFADEGDLFTMSVNVERIVDPETFDGDTTAVCDVIADAECDLVDGSCVCEYDDDTTCDDLFGHPERVVPVLAEEGMLLLSQAGCTCTGNTCTLKLLNSVPPVRVGEIETAAIHLGSDEYEYCDTERTCPNMDKCSSAAYGAHGCGYTCEKESQPYWCSSRCACNSVEAVVDCKAGVVCPDMHHCDPISYGEYGCGYGCTRDSAYYFCSDSCEECNA